MEYENASLYCIKCKLNSLLAQAVVDIVRHFRKGIELEKNAFVFQTNTAFTKLHCMEFQQSAKQNIILSNSSFHKLSIDA